MSNSANMVREWQDDTAVIRDVLRHEGPRWVDELILMKGSLRKVAKAAGLSPSYLSQVATGKTIISAGAFLKLDELMENGK